MGERVLPALICLTKYQEISDRMTWRNAQAVKKIVSFQEDAADRPSDATLNIGIFPDNAMR
jgi:hypothetical protein